jgi:hypothetical protein
MIDFYEMSHFRFSLAVIIVVLLNPTAEAAQKKLEGSCEPGRHWVKAYFRKAYTRSDGRHFKATTVTAHCSDNPPGYSFWIQKIKETALTNWPIKSEVAKLWSEEELERIIEALGYLPTAMQRDDISGIYRMERSVYFPNPASGDFNGDIAVYDSAFDQTNNLSQVLAHEIAHRIFSSLSPEEVKSYLYAAGWVNVGTDTHPDYELLREKTVDPDSKNSINEDFANNVEFFLFNPKKLQGFAPGAYNWISGHFGATFRLGKGFP